MAKRPTANVPKANRQRSPDAVDTVYSYRAYGVINVELIVQQPHAENHQQAGSRADHDGAEAVGHVASGGNAHQTGQRSIQAHGNIWLAILDPGKNHANHRCHRRRHRGGEENRAQLLNGGSGRAVEAIPAQPQDEYAQAAQRQVVPGESIHADDLAFPIRGELANARAQHLGADQGGNAANHVDGAGAGKVMEAQLCQPAAAPDPMRLNGVDQRGNDCGIDAVGEELGTLGHGAGHDGGGGGTEHQIEHETGSIEVLIRGENVQPRFPNQANQVFSQ